MKFVAQKYVYLNQTSPLASSGSPNVVFTADQDSDYMVSVYTEIVNDSTSGDANIATRLGWTDGIGTEVYTGAGSTATGAGTGQSGYASFPIHVLSGEDVTVYTTLSDSGHGSTAPGILYNLYITVIGIQ